MCNKQWEKREILCKLTVSKQNKCYKNRGKQTSVMVTQRHWIKKKSQYLKMITLESFFQRGGTKPSNQTE